MKIIVDDKIPYIKGQVERLADEVVYLPGAAITADDVRDADALLVRTRTHCNSHLLEGSRVRFVATATIGFDHLDTDFLREAGILWTNCPGCNATSVGQYVRNSLLLWAQHKGTSPDSLTVGIIGVGHVGTAVYQALQPLGCRLLLNDPPRAEREGTAGFSTLQELQQQCDVITIHTPLVRDGKHPTMHLVDDAFLHALPRCPLLINSGRGEVVDNEALERALDEGRIAQAIVDTWENEPALRHSLLQKVFIGTPHIAGYSADGKANATRMSLEALARWMGSDATFDVQPPALPADITLPADPWQRALALYNPMDDSRRLKAHPEDFEKQRGDYPLRREGE